MRVLVTGGSACGKSTFAESLAAQLPQPRYYLATMRPLDDELLAKIARHREMRRTKGFESLEHDVDVANVRIAEKATVLLECLCNLTANELFDATGAIDEAAYGRILDDIASLEKRCANLIVVTNDIGSGTTGAYDDSTRFYVETLGKLNAVLASRFDRVYELVCGIPLLLKDESLESAWLESRQPEDAWPEDEPRAGRQPDDEPNRRPTISREKEQV
ncbi:MAG: bifunctional adenosylcobinamide kinase/adenosylcobinamide-phosphate guanylyltransferase [Coriobacteriales bacterium]|jgi:adenosylcobinamide kinase/adenosylcobinamide-phosphate guanylyltransferase|nr:bifunctional adenosylcobinamide kinase/adenosylcobinamide-phosphate guanylyltransferase [Coriobacteriales bacterium]